MMTRLVLLLFLLFSSMLMARPRSQSATVEALIALDGKWAEANAKADTSALNLILSDDFIMTTARGEIKSKTQYISDFASGDRREDKHTPFDYRVKVYGTVAVMTHAADTIGTFKGGDTSGRQRTTHVWVHHGGRWQCVASQAARVEVQIPADAVVAEILQLDRTRQAAYVARDIATIRKIVAPDCIFGHSDGHVETRAEMFEALEKGTRVYQALVDENPRVHVYGNTATITGETRVEAIEDGQRISRRNHFLRVYARITNAWQMVANQSTRLSQ